MFPLLKLARVEGKHNGHDLILPLLQGKQFVGILQDAA
jgi:hypothetical protein